jgi:hypothetical protein
MAGLDPAIHVVVAGLTAPEVSPFETSLSWRRPLRHADVDGRVFARP